MCCNGQAVHNCTLSLNAFTCFNSELKGELVVREQACWDGQVHNMLLIQLLRSKVHVNALCFCVTVPSDSIQVTVNGLTDTVGVHLTKVNLSSHDIQNNPIGGRPFINLVQVELDVHQIRIHHLRSGTLGDVDLDTHVVAARSKQSQEIREVGLVLLGQGAACGVLSQIHCDVTAIHCVLLHTLIAGTECCRRSCGG